MRERTRGVGFSAHEETEERRGKFAYWLAHSHGFSVESPDGRVGVVQDVRRSLDTGEANVLVLRCGRLGTRVLTARVREVEAVVPRETRLLLRPDAQLAHQPAAPRRRGDLRLIHGGVPHRVR